MFSHHSLNFLEYRTETFNVMNEQGLPGLKSRP
jgi:hypothetical protein